MRRNRFLNLSFILALLIFLSFFASHLVEVVQSETEERLSSVAVYDDWNQTPTANLLGTPSVRYEQQEDFLRLEIERVRDASGVYLYVNGTRYDSAKPYAEEEALKWTVSKKKGSYIFSVNLPESMTYQICAEAYLKYGGNIVTGAKSEQITVNNLVQEHVELDEDAVDTAHGISMAKYYAAGKSGWNRWTTRNLTPQGICATEKYILITGYGPKMAKITVLDKRTQKGLAVLSLNEKILELNLSDTNLLSHVGGIAYDPEKSEVWVSGVSKKTILKIHMQTIEKYVQKATRMSNVFELQNDKDFTIYRTAYTNSEKERVYATPSFLEFEDGYLYIGTFSKESAGYLRKFKAFTTSYLYLVDELVIPNKIQGAVFSEDGKLILSQSYGRKNESRLYVYEGTQMRLPSYELSHIVNGLPPMSEELMILNDRLYILFESSAKRYRRECPDVQDTVWAVGLEQIYMWE